MLNVQSESRKENKKQKNKTKNKFILIFVWKYTALLTSLPFSKVLYEFFLRGLLKNTSGIGKNNILNLIKYTFYSNL